MENCDNCGEPTEQYKEITGPELDMAVPLCENCK